jgi:hypothetical protein
VPLQAATRQGAELKEQFEVDGSRVKFSQAEGLWTVTSAKVMHFYSNILSQIKTVHDRNLYLRKSNNAFCFQDRYKRQLFCISNGQLNMKDLALWARGLGPGFQKRHGSHQQHGRSSALSLKALRDSILPP